MSAVRTFCRAALYAAALPMLSVLGVPAAQGATDTLLFGGFEADNEDGRRIDLGVSVLTEGGTTFDLSGSRAETDSAALDLTSTALQGRVEHDFGRFGLGAGVRHVRDEDLSETLGWIGSGFVEFAHARLSASVESRSTDFDPVPFSIRGSDLGLSGGTTVHGTTSCDIDSLGYSLGLRTTSDPWSVYGSGTIFDYSSYDCSAQVTSVSNNQGPIRVRRAPVVRQLAAPLVDRIRGYTSTRLPYETTLLESSLMAGTAYTIGDRTLGFELYRLTEEFASADTLTALAYVGFPLGEAMNMEVTLGASDTDGIDSVVFAGLRFSAQLGR